MSAREYKEVIARLTAAADALRADDQDRAARLRQRLAGLDAEVTSAGERAALTRFGVDLHWEIALDALWPESWMKLRPRPGADPRAAAADIDALDARVDEATEVLLEAVRRRRFGLR